MFQDSEESGSRKLSENCGGLVERRSSGACNHFFQYLIPVYQLLPGRPYDWSIVTVYFNFYYVNYLKL